MEKAAAAMAVVSIPDDILLEILFHLKDAADLFRCATACKRWRRLIVEPSFLRRCWPDDAPPSSSACSSSGASLCRRGSLLGALHQQPPSPQLLHDHRPRWPL
ncbi:hypothetical protein ZWY2020_026116 [Hordeum vulgare]|nr:hypothetical protein ZWY2020_026116 [Hordeum vulgare]